MQVSTFPLLSFLHLHSLFTSFLSSAHIKAGNSPLSFFFSSFLPSFFPFCHGVFFQSTTYTSTTV